MIINDIRFSEAFRIGKSQWELDFVDIPLNRDIPLFVDPYAISIQNDPWCKECDDMINTYFDMLVQAIRRKDEKLIGQLLGNLHEPYETHLGHGRTSSKGRGIGKKQAHQLLKAFKNSEAVKSGFVYNISEATLMIDNISSDKISDITTNVIKSKLIEYTQSQCDLYNIPMRPVATGVLFDFKLMNWKDSYERLPVFEGDKIILVPKVIVRKHPDVSAEGFYDFILDYLQQEHKKSGDALATVLKNGKIMVYKYQVKEKYPFSTKFVYDFAKKNPSVLNKYKAYVRDKSKIMKDVEIEYKHSNPIPFDGKSVISRLQSISPGSENASEYHNHIIGIINSVFTDRIRRPVKEQEINEGRKRVDIVYDNGSKGFFANLSSLHRVKCPYIFVECKNYSKELNNPEFDQINGRLNDKRGRFGILTCRTIDDVDQLTRRQKDLVNDNGNYIIVLTDEDFVKLIEFRMNNNEEGIDDYMEDKIKQLLM